MQPDPGASGELTAAAGAAASAEVASLAGATLHADLLLRPLGQAELQRDGSVALVLDGDVVDLGMALELSPA